MKATFLGHGLNSENPNNVGKQLAKSFDSKIFDSFIGFVAFAAVSGVATLLDKIKKAKTNYKSIQFFIGVDNKGTSKEALELLVKENIETYIYHKDEEFITYHPKLFIFEGNKFSRIIVGSSNLTSSGFKNNIEASIQLDFRTLTDKQGLKLLTEIKDYYSGLIKLTDKNLRKLDTELIKILEEQNLLYSQHLNPNKKKEIETQPTDGENDNVSNTDTVEFDINSGFEPIDITTKEKELKFTRRDIENFDILLERYIQYTKKNNIKNVNKNTDDRQLFQWYRRMRNLINNQKLPMEFLQKLIDNGFSINEVDRERDLSVWDLNFEKLKEYKNKFNPNSSFTHVPQFHDKENPYYALGNWCAYQKQRRKGNYIPIWTEYEEDKMNSINFLWDSKMLGLGGVRKDDIWADSLVELEEYYNNPNNYKTIPHQKTKIGKWLNEQITTKLTGTRSKNKKFLNPLREEMLGDLLKRNGVEWEWQKQKERESIEALAAEWLKNNIQSNYESLTPKERKKFNDNVASKKYNSKRWPDWKREILLNVGMELPDKIID